MPRLIDADAFFNDFSELRDYEWASQEYEVEAEPVRHGRWVHGKELSRDYIGDVCVSIHYDKCWCSECNYPVEGHPLWMYCPHCGAKMDEVD